MLTESLVVVRQAAEPARYLAGAGIVRGRRQVQRAEAAGEIAQVTRGGIGGAVGIPALVHPGVDSEAVVLCGALHELPHAHGPGAAGGGVGEAAFDQGKVHEVGRESLLLQPLADHPFVPRHAREPDAESFPGGAPEEVEVVLDPVVIVEGGDVDVPPDRIDFLGSVFRLVDGRSGGRERLEYRFVRGGIGRDPELRDQLFWWDRTVDFGRGRDVRQGRRLNSRGVGA